MDHSWVTSAVTGTLPVLLQQPCRQKLMKKWFRSGSPAAHPADCAVRAHDYQAN